MSSSGWSLQLLRDKQKRKECHAAIRGGERETVGAPHGYAYYVLMVRHGYKNTFGSGQIWMDRQCRNLLHVLAEAHYHGCSDLIRARGMCHTARLGALQGKDTAHLIALCCSALVSAVTACGMQQPAKKIRACCQSKKYYILSFGSRQADKWMTPLVFG